MTYDPVRGPDNAPNPYPIYAHRGEHGLRVWLELKDMATLRRIIRHYRLDPGRVSSQWRKIERIAKFIAEVVAYRDFEGQVFFRSEQPETPLESKPDDTAT